MPTYELSTTPYAEYKDRFPIETLEKLKHIPTTANTPEELRGILYETDALTILAGVAIANAQPDDRFSGPAIFGGHPNFFRKFARDEKGELQQVDEAGFGITVLGVYKTIRNREIFIPRTLNVFGNDGPDRLDGLRFALVTPVVGPYNYNEHTTATYADGITPIYNSNLPIGEVKAPSHGPNKKLHRFENRPPAVLKCIKEIAAKFVEAEVIRDLEIKLAMTSAREKVAA